MQQLYHQSISKSVRSFDHNIDIHISTEKRRTEKNRAAYFNFLSLEIYITIHIKKTIIILTYYV